jgi:drug/metabolite transporter (DMT)-like permease
LKTRPVDLALVLFVCLIWATNYFVIKAVLPYVDPITFAFLRAVLGGLFVFAIGGYAVKGIRRGDVLWLAVLGLFNVALFLVLLNVSLQTANAGVDSTLVYTQPVLVAALAPLVGESMTRSRVAGIAAAFGGIVVIFLPNILDSTLVVGDLYALLASLSWAIAIILFKRWRTGIRATAVTAVQSVIGGAFILPALALGHPFLDPVPLFWVYLAYNVVLSSGLAYVIFWRVLSRMPAAQFTSYFFLVPTFAVIIASAMQLSAPPAFEVAGTALVAVGIIAVNR